MKRLTLVLASIACLTLLSPIFAPSAGAARVCNQTSFKFNNSNCPTIRDVFIEVFRFLTAVAGVAAVGAYGYAGFTYSSAGGNPGQAQKGITIAANTTVGLIVFFGLFGFINFLIPENVLL